MAEKKWAGSLADWKRRSVIDATLPSTMRVTLRPLTLDELAAADGLPDDLMRVVLLEMVPGGVVTDISLKLKAGDAESLAAAKKLSEDVVRVRDRIVLAAVVDPALKPADLAKLDPFDKQMIADIAQRRIVLDAAGRRVGADALHTFRVIAEELGCDPTGAEFAKAVGKAVDPQ